MFARIETQQTLAIAAKHRIRRYHFGVEQRAPRQKPVKHTAMGVGPVHHRCNGEDMSLILLHYSDIFQRLRPPPSHAFVPQKTLHFSTVRGLRVMVLWSKTSISDGQHSTISIGTLAGSNPA